jgi:hypothetical protein
VFIHVKWGREENMWFKDTAESIYSPRSEMQSCHDTRNSTTYKRCLELKLVLNITVDSPIVINNEPYARGKRT